MGGIMHEGESYSRQMVVDSALSSVSNNPVKNRILKALFDALDDSIGSLTDLDTTDKSSLVDAINEVVADETVLKKIYGSLNYGAISDTNITNSSAGIRYYVCTTAGTAHLPSNAGSGILIDITHEANVAMQIYINWNTNAIYIREKEVQDWPTTGTYGWKKIYPDEQAIKTQNFSFTCTDNKNNQGSIDVTLSGYSAVSAIVMHPYISADCHVRSMSATSVSWSVYGLENNLINTTGYVKVVYART